MGRWEHWKEWEREWTLHPCKYCDAHADVSVWSWKDSMHRWWCPALTRKLRWAGLIFPFYFRWMGLAWWLCVASAIVCLFLAVALPWLAIRYGPARQ